MKRWPLRWKVALYAALLAVGYEEIEIDQRGFRSGALNELSTGASLSRH